MRKEHRKYSEAEIDEFVIAEANQMSKWEKPIGVEPARLVAFCLTPSIVEKAKILARRHKMHSYRSWLMKVIREQMTQEEKRYQSGAKVG